ncbi:hypothetical protein BSY18_3932 (plasmid) [Blastomonas sp. RAC04]|nr:hypothetical protein BSY18_3932 [Blastomonas sp. RAC04]
MALIALDARILACFMPSDVNSSADTTCEMRPICAASSAPTRRFAGDLPEQSTRLQIMKLMADTIPKVARRLKARPVNPFAATCLDL